MTFFNGILELLSNEETSVDFFCTFAYYDIFYHMSFIHFYFVYVIIFYISKNCKIIR